MILEKDFWVSWLLALLFADPALAPHMVFKGGTCLSKVFGVIDRFSEDIDLCLLPESVDADAVVFDALGSRVKRDAAVLVDAGARKAELTSSCRSEDPGWDEPGSSEAVQVLAHGKVLPIDVHDALPVEGIGHIGLIALLR